MEFIDIKKTKNCLNLFHPPVLEMTFKKLSKFSPMKGMQQRLHLIRTFPFILDLSVLSSFFLSFFFLP